MLVDAGADTDNDHRVDTGRARFYSRAHWLAQTRFSARRKCVQGRLQAAAQPGGHPPSASVCGGGARCLLAVAKSNIPSVSKPLRRRCHRGTKIISTPLTVMLPISSSAAGDKHCRF